MPVPADPPSAQLRGRKRRLRPVANGFTLLEVLLAMAILVVLVAGLAGITGASIRLGKTVLEAQQEDAIRDGFERLIRENLAEIPQDSPLLLREGILNGSQTVILGKAAGLFPVSGLPLVTQSVALETRRDRSGLFSLWLLYYAGDLARAIQDNSMDSELLVQIPFKDGLEILRWRVYDPTTDEWLDVWEETGRRPHYLEMTYRFAGDTADHRMVFWMPRLQSTPGGQGGAPGGPGDGLNPNLPGGGGTVGPGNPGGGGGPGGGRGPGGGSGPGGGPPGIKVEVPR